MVSRHRLSRLLGLICLAASGAASAAAKPIYHWSAGPNLPAPVQEIYPAVVQGNIYVAGGLAQDGEAISISDDVFVLEDKPTWQHTVSLPEPRHHAMLVNYRETLWLFGGFINSARGQWTNTDAVMSLNLQKNQWEKQTPMPKLVSETVAINLAGKIHVIGGRTVKGKVNGRWHDHTDTDWHGVFDPKADVWTTAASMPTPRNSACAVAYDDKIHVIGGRQVDGGNVDRHEVYDPADDSWKTLPRLPQEQAGIACVVYRHGIFVFGGEHFIDGGDVFSDVWRYDLHRQNWSKVSVMPLPRHGLGAVLADDKVWLIGGAAKAGAKATSDTVSQLTSLQ